MVDALPGYRIHSLLGRGGMGAVYEGEQISLDRRVAIKLLPAELGADPEFQARFRREAKSMAKLNHPNIVQIYDFGQTAAGHCYFVMEFVDGTDLHRLIREGKLDVTGALNAVSQICDALQYAHDEGFVHRDIKPANIFINRQGLLKVGDFGLAKLVEGGSDDEPTPTDLANLTVSGVAMGTLNYIAPEQLSEGGSVDRRADIYSLGVMFYEMLTREVPRGAVKEPSKRVPMLDERIDGVVFKAMDPDPSERYQTALELRSDVDAIRLMPPPEPPPEPPVETPEEAPMEAIPPVWKVKVAPPRTWPRSRRSKRENRPVLPLVAGVTSLGAIAGLVGWIGWKGADDSERKGMKAGIPTPGGNPAEVSAPVLPVEFEKVTKDAPFTNSLGMTFVPLPGTGLLMCRHETRKSDYAAFFEDVGGFGSSFWKSTTDEGVPVSSGDDHPVVNVDHAAANAFCSWLSQKEGRTYRLPSDREWSLAAGISAVEPAGLYPGELVRLMGNPAGDGEGNYADLSRSRSFPNRSKPRNIDDGFPTTAPVMSFRPNALGIYDLAGNVWEHTSDFFSASRNDLSLRGNCYNDPDAAYKSRARRYSGNRGSSDGFRCVLVVEEEVKAAETAKTFAAKGRPLRIGLSRYQVIEGEATWAEARAEAERRGGHLATFGTEAEREAVVGRFGAEVSGDSPLWIGGHGFDRSGSTAWFWVTEEYGSPKVWPGRRIGAEEGDEYYYAGLVSSGVGEAEVAAFPALGKVVSGSGFLVEWEDIDGDPVPAVADELPDAPFTNSLGMQFLPVPGTDILLCIHETRKSDYAAFAAETPELNGVWKNPPAFEGVAVSEGQDHPVVMTNWYEARAFCEWLGRKEGRTYRLPTDHEWSRAAELGDFESVGSLPSDLSSTISALSLFPWGVNIELAKEGAGNFFDPAADARFKGGSSNSNWKLEDGFLTTAPVMKSKPNRIGFHDLHGNVSEMCEDRWGPDRGIEGVDGRGSSYRAVRGGNWRKAPKSLAERERSVPASWSDDIGFRVALVARPAAPPKPPLSERTRPVGEPKRFGSSRYQLVEGAVTWGEARVRAEEMGGHLASLAFAPEAEWVGREFGAGLSDAGAGFWMGLLFHNGARWINGESFRHEEWIAKLNSDVYNNSAFANQAAGILTKSADGRIGWDYRPLNGKGENAPRAFLVEWDDIDGTPALPATGSTSREPFTNSLGMRFVPIEGTDILLCLHETRRRDYEVFAKEVSAIDTAWMDPRFETVSVGVEPDHPVVMVNWHEARAFCDWLSRKEGRTYRLPTDREWSVAAGIGALEVMNESPLVLSQRRTALMSWGAVWPPPPDSGNFADRSFDAKVAKYRFIPEYDDGSVTTSPVMRFPAGSSQIHDLDGNVSEWIEDRRPGFHSHRLLRGSSWFDAETLQTSRRLWDVPNSRRFYFGFRCAVVVGD